MIKQHNYLNIRENLLSLLQILFNPFLMKSLEYRFHQRQKNSHKNILTFQSIRCQSYIQIHLYRLPCKYYLYQSNDSQDRNHQYNYIQSLLAIPNIYKLYTFYGRMHNHKMIYDHHIFLQDMIYIWDNIQRKNYQ